MTFIVRPQRIDSKKQRSHLSTGRIARLNRLLSRRLNPLLPRSHRRCRLSIGSSTSSQTSSSTGRVSTANSPVDQALATLSIERGCSPFQSPAFRKKRDKDSSASAWSSSESSRMSPRAFSLEALLKPASTVAQPSPTGRSTARCQAPMEVVKGSSTTKVIQIPQLGTTTTMVKISLISLFSRTSRRSRW